MTVINICIGIVVILLAVSLKYIIKKIVENQKRKHNKVEWLKDCLAMRCDCDKREACPLN